MELLALIASIEPGYTDVVATSAVGFQFWILRKVGSLETSIAELRVHVQNLNKEIKS